MKSTYNSVMVTIVKEPVVTTPVRRGATNTQTYEYLVYYLFGAIDILLAFRFLFKLAGANNGSYFVTFIYTITNLLIMPFEGIFRRFSAQGVETTSVFEPAVIVAVIVYTVIAIGIVKFIRISSGEEQSVE